LIVKVKCLPPATHAGDEEVEHGKIPFCRGDFSAGIFWVKE
jgi:hypothetical protein